MRIAVSSAVAIAIFSAAGCKSMRPSNLTSVGTAHRAWVTLPNQRVVLVNGPKVINDTLVGYVDGEYKEIPAAEVKQIRVKEWNRGRTAALGVLGLAAFAGVAYAVTSAGKSNPDVQGTCIENPDRCDPTQ